MNDVTNDWDSVTTGQFNRLFPAGDSNQLLGMERVALIDPAAIRHNVRRIKELAPNAQLMAAVKTGGYGHGAVTAAKAVLEAGADWLGLAHITEALELRAAGITAPMLAWLHTPESDFARAVEQNIALGVTGWDLLRVADAAVQTGKLAEVHLKIDTGLGRHGATVEDFPHLAQAAARYERRGLIKVTGIFTHLAVADEPQRPENDLQLSRFNTAVHVATSAGLTGLTRHVVSTAGAFTRPDAHYDMIRVGAGLYGLTPFPDKSPRELGLLPVMELQASVANVKTIQPGEGVSYGLTWVAQKPTKIALIPMGFSDGIPRNATNAPISINNRIYHSVGRIAMDQFVINLEGLDSDVKVGDRATIFGGPSGISADAFAAAAMTIGCELVTKIGARVPRIVSDSAEPIPTQDFADADLTVERDGAYVDIIDTSTPDQANI